MQELTISFSGVVELARALGFPITIFDLETTTFRGRPNFGIIEVSCFSATLEGTGVVHGHLIDPERPIDAIVSKLTGIVQSMVRGKESWGHRYADLFQTLVASHYVGGFNIKTFDCPAVVEMNARYGQPLKEGFTRILDVRQLYLTLEKPESKKGKLVQVAEFYGVRPHGKLHRAEADVILTLETLDAMIKGYGVNQVIDAISPSKVKKLQRPGSTHTLVIPRIAVDKPTDTAQALVALAASGTVRTLGDLAGKLQIDLRSASFEMGKAVDDGRVNPLPFADKVTLEWLRSMLVEMPTDTVADGRLKPIYTYLVHRQPNGIALDYLQLRIGMLDCGLTWSTLKSPRQP